MGWALVLSAVPSCPSPPLRVTRTWQRKMRRACTSASVRLSVGASASAPGPRRLSCSPSTCKEGLCECLSEERELQVKGMGQK